jgi:hypothetical protein
MMFSSNALRFVLVLAAAFNAVTYAQTIDLGVAGNFAILAETAISTVPDSVITGDIGVWPKTRAAMTGFSPTAHSSGNYFTSDQITGKGCAETDIGCTPSSLDLEDAVLDMRSAYTTTEAINGSPNFVTDTDANAAGDLSGSTLNSGVYTFTSNVKINSSVTFAGSTTDIFIIQTTKDLKQAANTEVILSGGAKAENIFWQVAGYAEILAGAHMEGILLVKTHVVFVTGSSLNGRVLTQTACTLDTTTINAPTRRNLRKN